MGAGSLIIGCAGPQGGGYAPAQKSPLQHKALAKVQVAADGTISHVNDTPRNRNSARFEERRAAAHARGLWLTDELNAPKIIRSGGRTRAVSTVQNGCGSTDCGSGGGGVGGSNGGSVAYFDDNGGDFPYDVELDYPDGTSVLFESFVDSQNNTYLTTLEASGYYFLWSVNNQTAPPIARPTSTPNVCIMDMDGFTYLTPGPCPAKIPKILCPLAAGGVGLIARWAAIAATKNPEAGTASMTLVAGSYMAACNGQP